MEWFKHDIGAFRDEKIQALRIDCGGAAVDAYYAIIELIYEGEEALTMGKNQAETKSVLHGLCLGWDGFLKYVEGMEQNGLLSVEYHREGDGIASVVVNSRRASAVIADMNRLAKIARQNGKSGGRPKKKNPDETQTKPRHNPDQTQSAKDYNTNKTNKKDVSKDTSKKAEPDEAKTVKRSYGENGNVLLTDDELSKLQEKFPDDWKQRIDDLSFYIGSTGKTYKSHYLTILNWERKNHPKGVNGNAIADKYRDFEKRNPPRRVTY